MKDCAIVKDLLPLYVEDLVSEETKIYIEAHLDECEDCKKELSALKTEEVLTLPTAAEDEIKPFKKAMGKLNVQFNAFSYVLIVLFILLGFSYTAEEKMMYNSLIMPLVGVFGYVVFRSKVIYKLPLLVALVNVFALLFGIVSVDLFSAFLWTLIYMLFVLTGSLIAFLIHYAFRKEKLK